MKSSKFFLSILLSMIILMTSFGCTGQTTLAVPAGVTVDLTEYVVSWFTNPSARKYDVKISPVGTQGEEIRSTNRTSISLADLPEGEYAVSVRCVAGKNGDVYSDWSDSVPFLRGYESGLLFTLDPNGTEYAVTGLGSVSGPVLRIGFADEDGNGSYRGKPVTEIGDSAFQGKTTFADEAQTPFTSVAIGPLVRAIGKRAFYNCANLQSVDLSQATGLESIGDSAFRSCTSLKEIAIPDTVTELPELTFGYCTALESVTLSESLVTVGKSAFYGCTALTEITLPDSVETVMEAAFSNDPALATVNFGSGIRSVGDEAFRGSGLTTLNFKPLDGELVLGGYCFANMPTLKQVTLPEGTTRLSNGVFYSDTDLGREDVSLPGSILSVGVNAFTQTELYTEQNTDAAGSDGFIYAGDWLIGLTEAKRSEIVELREADFRIGTVGIADQAFLGVVLDEETGQNVLVGPPELYSVGFPSSLKYIGAYSFYNTPHLYRVQALYENSLIEVGYGAFSSCTELGNIHFSRGLRRIEPYAFFGCTVLDDNPDHPDYLTPDTLEQIGFRAFDGTKPARDGQFNVYYMGNWLVGVDFRVLNVNEEDPNSLMIISQFWRNFDGELRDGTVGIADSSFLNCLGLQRINLNGVTRIGQNAFAYCRALESVQFGSNLTEIPAFAFFDCENLFDISFPIGLRTIGDCAFADSRLRRVQLRDTFVSSIGKFAFYQCAANELTLPDTLTEIKPYAFFSCGLLTEVSLPDSVTTLGERAFAGCASLESVKLGARLTEIAPHTFRDCVTLREVVLPESVEKVGRYAFSGCVSLQTLDLGTVKEIEKYAFANTALQTLILPDTVQTIGESAFLGCYDLRSVTMLTAPDMVGAYAFFDANATFYMAFDASETEGWNDAWNLGFRPVIWGCERAEEGYIASVTVGEGTVTDPHAYQGVAGPGRKGYRFVGWTTDPAAASGELITANGIIDVPAGTRLYAVWEAEKPALPDSEQNRTASAVDRLQK